MSDCTVVSKRQTSLRRAFLVALLVSATLECATGRPSPAHPESAPATAEVAGGGADVADVPPPPRTSRRHLLQDIIDDVLRYSRLEEEAKRLDADFVLRNNLEDVSGSSGQEDSLDSEEKMQGDMPVADDAPVQPTGNRGDDHSRHITNYFPSLIPGEQEERATRHMMVRAPSSFNTTADQQSYLDDLAVSLSSINVSINGTTTSLVDSTYTSPQKSVRERNKEQHLKNIKEQILRFLGMIDRPQIENSTMPKKQIEYIEDMYNKMKNQTWPPADVYTEKVQSFYPSCDLPKNTDEEMWHDAHTMNMLFDISSPQVANGTTVNVIAAKLRLFKISQGNVTVTPALCAPGQLPTGEDSATGILPPSTGAAPAAEDDQQIRVSVYWYTRSLKRNKTKRKLLDSKMLSIYGDEWTEFNVKQAAIEWRNKSKPHRNFGLVVEVENEDNVILPASQYLSAMNCSKEASTARPIPGFLVDAARIYVLGNGNRTNQTRSALNAANRSTIVDYSNSVNYHSYLFPMIDLCTNEVPIHEAENAALYIHAQHLAQHTVFDAPPGAAAGNASRPAGGGDLERDDYPRSRQQPYPTHHAVGETARTEFRSNPADPVTIQLQSPRGTRHPRRHPEAGPHRHRHHHGGPEDAQQGRGTDGDGHELMKQIVQRVILENHNSTDVVQATNR